MNIRIPLPVMVLFLGLLFALTNFPAKAGGTEPFEPINAKAMIDTCWALSKEDRDSGVTGRMRSGSARTAGCLQNVIVEQASEMFGAAWTLNFIVFAASAVGAVNTNAMKTADAISDIPTRFIVLTPCKS